MSSPDVVIAGGGLAGLAAAVALAERGLKIELHEARRSLGGRAGSFRDASTDELVDHCQHVSMDCCTNLADFCRRVGVEHLFRRDPVLRFVGPDGRVSRFAASPLPAPLHLGPAFWRLKYLSLRDKLGIARATWKLMRLRPSAQLDALSAGEWLRAQRQSTRAMNDYWNVILVSALGEELDRASLAAARKVIVDGFLSARDAYVVQVPRVSLAELYGTALERWLADRRIALRLSSPIKQVGYQAGPKLTLADGSELRPKFAVLAVPWHRLADMIAPDLAVQLPWLAGLESFGASPITGVHLWFDRAILPLEHAVLVGRLSQWVFHRSDANSTTTDRHYYQVVVSASRNLAGRSRESVVEEVCRELAEIFPLAREAQRLHARVVTEQAAVFSVRPGLEALRPAQTTEVPGLFVAGDWTSTGWPATMEGAVRSGYLAAEGVLKQVGQPSRIVAEDLRAGWLARLLIRGLAP